MKKFFKVLFPFAAAAVISFNTLSVFAATSTNSSYKVSGELYGFSDNKDSRYGKITVADSAGTVISSSYNMTDDKNYIVYAHLDGNALLNVGKGTVNYVLRGDTDGNSQITASDASKAFSAYKAEYKGNSSSLTDIQAFAANVDWGIGTNTNTKLTAQDASYIFSYYKESYKNGSASWKF